jgi:amino acid adenylation domain-containing protein
VRRHAALRAVFHRDAEHQTIRAEGIIDLPMVDLSRLDDRALQAEISRLIDLETHEPFDLENGPLFRTKLIREAPDRHLLILTAHHIVCDGWSAVILVRDLGALYAALRHGVDARLPPPARYEDYVTARAAGAPGETARTALDWWASRFADAAPTLDLPLDRPRPAAKSYSGRQIESRLDEDLCREIRKVGAKNGSTLFATLLAAFEVLLHRLTAQSDFVVGVAVAGQASIDDGDHLVGHCVNTLPLRVAVDPTAAFTQHLRSARKALVDAQDHAELTFGSLIRRLNLPRDPRRTPLVDMTFNVDRVGAPVQFAGLAVEPLPPPKSFVNFEIGMNLVDDGHSVTVECAFNTALFDEATIRRWLGHYETLLRAIAADPDRPILELPILTDGERREILSGSSVDARRFPGATCLHRGFEEQVSRTPEAVALVFEGSSVTYDALNRRANRLAHHLLTLGVGPDVLVGLCVDRSIDMVVAILGILKAGGAYLPLDPTYPPDRLAFLLTDSAVPVLVTEERHLGGFKAPGATIVCLDRDGEMLARLGSGNPTTEVGPHHLAYVIYTSGSTGKPKGVLVTHHNVARLFEATQDWYGFDAGDVWTLFHSYAFDFSVWELWGALLYGGRLVVVPYWVSRSPEAFHEMLKSERVTVLNQTPSAFRQLIQADLASGTSAGEMALRTVIFGGEALELQSLRPWLRRYGDARPRLVNMYGITETTVHVTYRPITIADVEDGAGSVIGIPIPDLQVYVLDPGGEPSPIGVAGEMYVGGAGVARGYLNRPELTAERFIRHPFDADPNARLYRTGDLARRLADGDLEYLGRIDLQVKIRGFRIELGEIESVIGQHPAVRETTVIAREDGPGDKRLVAYVVMDGGSPGTIEELRTLVRANLPDYMVPAQFMSLAALPLTAHGKVDRKALPAPDPAHRATSRPYAPPQTQTEQTMAGIWAQVLRIERVGIDDNFFEMGGHSVQAAQIMTQLRAAFPLDLPLRLLFQSPTVEGLAAAIDALAWAARGASTPAAQGGREEFEI